MPFKTPDELVQPRYPHLAQVAARLSARPPSMHDVPMRVDPDLFALAQAEHRASLAARGWAPVAAKINRPNFLLYGVPVVADE